jgi:galactonate dehydratase
MEITSVTTCTAPPRWWSFLRVETDVGVVGWGEPVVEGRAVTVAAAVDELADHLATAVRARAPCSWLISRGRPTRVCTPV